MSTLGVVVIACGAPKRGMGWYHATQLLDGRIAGAQLTDIVEPFFLGPGRDTELGRDFAAWAAESAPGVALHASVRELPRPAGRKLAILCGRTSDNPRLFREAVDAGFSHIYLEKPGAPTVAELEEMAAYAAAKGVPVFMGFNRNFSKYVRQAQEFAATAPAGAMLTMGRRDCFNTPEAVDECFERNSEGMLKNMMIHEIVVMISCFGLKVDAITEIVVDRAFTKVETRRGYTDLSQMACVIRTREGREFKLWGDRSNGEYGELVVTSGGKELFRALRPDQQICDAASALEAARPGCMPYFYLQDGEYLELKEHIVRHVLAGKPGSPEGAADVRAAIEGLKLCDRITAAMLEGGKFEIALGLSNAPCSWGVDFADCSTNPPWQKVIQCIAEAGYAGTELGPVGYYDPEGLSERLASLRLQLVAGNIFEKLHEPAEVPAILQKVHASCRTLKKFGAKYFVIVPHCCEEKVATAGRPADAPRLPQAQWDLFMDAIKQVAVVVKSYGIVCTLHPHAGCWIEYEDEVEKALADLPADLVGLCLDTGHFTYAGMDAVAKLRQHGARVPYLHFKDIDGAVLRELQAQKKSFWDGIKAGVFCPLGRGLVDFPAVLRTLKDIGFAGWVTVEQDADNSISDETVKLMRPFECCKLNVEYLRSLGVVSREPFAPPGREAAVAGAAYVGRFDGSESRHASPAMAAVAGRGCAAEADPSSLPTSTKWSVLSSRVEGLVAELAEVIGKQDAYCVSQSTCEGPAMRAVREKMLATRWAEAWAAGSTMFSYGEEMSTDPLEAMLLKELTFMSAPRRVLEVGMFVGYGAMAMLEGSSTCQVVSLEIDPYLKGWLSSCLADAGLCDLAARHEVVVGPALDTLPKLTGQFDLVFVDANKAEYKRYLELILEHRLLSASGVVICDNVLYNGYPYAHSHFDAQPARRAFGNAIKEFNQWVCDHPLLEQVVLPVRDGISLIRVRGAQAGARGAPAAGGNLARRGDAWHMLREGEVAPAGAALSDCRVDASASEYAAAAPAAAGEGPRCWMSKSLISFEYRVVEVPRGSLLDPACDALIFGHLPFGSPERAAAASKPQRRLVVIDETVYGLYGERVRAYFEARGVAHEILRLPLVEENKSVEMTLKVCEKMKKFNVDRRTEPVIAIGGGVCLDVVGLAASLFRRRTPYIRVPTTALAYVDASVGAKNGCNFLGSKNRLGTYVPPAAALLDCAFFATQQRREVSNSLGEMAKMAIVKSAELFELLEKHSVRLIENRFAAQDDADEVPARVLRLSIETMLEELAPNLWEHSLDRLVDFGHAVGQNLEMSALGSEQELMHGEAVACDMAYMSVLSCQLGLITEAERDRILAMLRGCEVPVYHPNFSMEFLREALQDRIQNSMGMRLPLPVGIGEARIVNDVSAADFERAHAKWLELCRK